MAAAASFARSVLRSNSLCNSAARLAFEAKTARSPFRMSKQKPLTNGIFFRSPVELSCCVESLMPYHTATSSALLTSMLSVSHRYGWLPEETMACFKHFGDPYGIPGSGHFLKAFQEPILT